MKGLIAATVVAIGLLVPTVANAQLAPAPLLHLPRIPPPALRSDGSANVAGGPQNTEYSNNWAGYIDHPVGNAHTAHTETEFQVPMGNCDASALGNFGAYAAFWTGLDGSSAFWGSNAPATQSVEQVGVTEDCTSYGPATYSAWYEMFPLYPVSFTGVQPGDNVWTSVTYQGYGKYRLTLVDQTQNAGFNVVADCPTTCERLGAEQITELPGGGLADGIDLFDYATVRYHNTRVQATNGKWGTMDTKHGYWNSAKIVMVDQTNDVMVNPGGLNRGGGAFWTPYTHGS